MADKKISIRLQTPADENGDRVDMHPITTSDEVIVSSENATEAVTLTEKLEQMGTITISNAQPDHACIWAKIIG